MRISQIIGLLLLFFTSCQSVAQEVSLTRSVAFYNVENLFDTENDPASDDGAFTPNGLYKWTEEQFREKTVRIAFVLAEIAADLVGLAEIENKYVLDCLTKNTLLEDLGYRYIHFDSPDPRGIDVALLYRPGAFRPESMRAVRYKHLPRYRTRELLHVNGQWRGHPAHVLVCHLPSVLSPKQVRSDAAASVRFYADSLMKADPDHLLLLMGDFNANPDNQVMKIITKGSRLENPFHELYKKGYGSYHYRGRWNMYDSILVGGTVPGSPTGRVFIKDYLIQPDGVYKGYPYRSFSGTEYIGGYSDHLPVVLVLE